MDLVQVKIKEIIPYKKNPRNNKNTIKAVEESIKQCSYISPIIIDENNVILAGHTRYYALKNLKYKECQVIIKNGLSEEQKKKYRLLDNKLNELSSWDMDLLKTEIDGLDFGSLDLDWGIDELEEDEQQEYNGINPLNLADRFIVPPFSVLDSSAKYWQDRKKEWINYGINSGEGRDVNLIGKGLESLAKKHNKNTSLTGTSIFDPVLTEIVYNWFSNVGDKIFDPFAGGSVRGIIAEKLGRHYTGIDLRQEQIDADIKNAKKLGVKPDYICDDSQNADKYVDDDSIDMILSCPPYVDLEKYSDNPLDISNMNYEEFKKAYTNIINIACKKLKQDSFVVWVVGEVRDKKGLYYNFVDDTKRAFINNGCNFYNDIILLNALATAALRVGHIFNTNRKVVKVHQNVLVFYKGDPKNIKAKYKPLLDDETMKIMLENSVEM